MAWIATGSLLGALALQGAIIAGAILRGGSSSYQGGASLLLSEDHHLVDFLAVTGINLAWLVAIFMLAWPIGRLWSWGIHDSWDHPKVNLVARFLYPFVAVCLIAILCWIFSEQALALDSRLESHWALLGTLPHGTLEFGAFLLPLAAAASCIAWPAEKPGRLLARALWISLPLIAAAALVEVYLTPHLLLPYRI